jgi:hypothetical protein
LDQHKIISCSVWLIQIPIRITALDVFASYTDDFHFGVTGFEHNNIAAVKWLILHDQNPLMSATRLVMDHV